MKQIMLAMLLMIACTQPAAERAGAPRGAVTPMTSEPRAVPELIIIVDARYFLAMGYGHVWKANVRNVVDGTLKDSVIELSLLDNHEGRKYAGRFRGGEEVAVRLRLRRVPELPIALQGFVGKDGTIWELIDVDA
jgi:hypothetical protein